jgi:hypothetical protein
MFLSGESHLVRLYTAFQRSVSTIKEAPLHGVITGWGPAILSLRSVLIAASYVAAIIGGILLAIFLDPVRLWRESRISVFEIAATGILCTLAIVILFLLRKVQALQQTLRAAAPPLERTLIDDLRTGATDRAMNNRSPHAAAWDPGAIKETFKRKQQEFEV